MAWRPPDDVHRCPRCRVSVDPVGEPSFFLREEQGLVHVTCMTQAEILNLPMFHLYETLGWGLSDLTMDAVRDVVSRFQRADVVTRGASGLCTDRDEEGG